MAKVTKYKKVTTEVIIERAAISLYPERIIICSDENELEFIESKKIDSKIMVYYRYTKSETKKGLLLPMPDTQLSDMIRKGICKPILNK